MGFDKWSCILHFLPYQTEGEQPYGRAQQVRDRCLFTGIETSRLILPLLESLHTRSIMLLSHLMLHGKHTTRSIGRSHLLPLAPCPLPLAPCPLPLTPHFRFYKIKKASIDSILMPALLHHEIDLCVEEFKRCKHSLQHFYKLLLVCILMPSSIHVAMCCLV